MAKLRLASWNVNGIRAIHKKGFQDWLLKERFDIVCLQETKIAAEQLTKELTQLKGYKSYFSHAERKGYSGVAIYTRHEPRSITEGLGNARFDSEGRTLIADYGDFLLFNIYFPNGKSGQERLDFKMKFYAHFLEYLKKLHHKKRNIIICGDFNTAHKEIDLARPKVNHNVSGFLPEERAWMDSFTQAGYLDTFRLFNQDPQHYTWWHLVTAARARNVGWRIDYFFASAQYASNLLSASIQSDVMGSDHCPVVLSVKN